VGPKNACRPLLKRRKQVLDMLTAEQNPQELAEKDVQAYIEKVIPGIEKAVGRIWRLRFMT